MIGYTVDQALKFLHPSTRIVTAGRYVSRHVMTGELQVELASGNRIFIHPADLVVN